MSRHARRSPKRARHAVHRRNGTISVVGVIGEVCATVGVLMLLFVAYTIWGTGIQTAQAQDDLHEQLEEILAPTPDPTSGQPIEKPDEIEIGEAYGILRIPRFGDDWSWAIVEGTQPDDLRDGPGHYTDSADAGELGNFAVAGHRSGHGNPFVDFPELRVGDLVDVTTRKGTFVYELDDAPDGDPDGNKIATTDVWVVDPVPGEGPEVEPTERRITLTTCWPRIGAEARMYATGVLVDGPQM